MPKRPSEDYVRVIPLGGLETFGMNCCLVEHNGSMLMFDCGIAFPDSRHYGVDYYLPDWTYALENADILDGIVLTHAHLDHIGAIPFLLSNIDVPVYSGRLTLEQVKRQLGEWNIKPQSPFVEVRPRDVFEIGPYELEFIHMNHSIANAMSVAIGTSLGHLIFTGDWKIDHTPIGEDVADLPSLARLGDDGVLAIIGDSTNALVPGSSKSEREVQSALKQVISNAPARVIIGQFSSNVPRIRGLIEVANQLDKRIALLGRSLNQMTGIARETGFLPIEGRDPFISADEINKFPGDRLIICATGSQAEPRASLSRIARGDHHQVSLEPDDTVVVSARMIPGNESAIQSMLNSLVRRGANVITPQDAPVHTSGHAYSEDMKLLMNLTRPDYLVPVHGEHRMRLAHSKIAEDLGFDSRLIEEGDVLEFTSDVARVIDRIPIGRIVVDGKLFGDVDDVQLRDRRKLAYTGMIVAFAVLDRSNGELTSGPDLLQRGFLADDGDTEGLLEEATKYAHEAVQALSPDARSDADEVGEALRTAVRRFFRRRIDRKPVVVPLVHEL